MSETAKGRFHVQGNKIIDPHGKQFIVKGMNALYGPFLPEEPEEYAEPQYRHARRDFAMMKSMGINLVRIWVSTMLLHDEKKQSQLVNVITWAEHEGLVIEITNGYNETDGPDSRGIRDTNRLMRYLARTYKDHPNVWLQPLNEPECEFGSGEYCSDWDVWHTEHSRFIRTIRRAGFQNPIVVNTPDYSWDLTRINDPRYKLNDDNLIYGAHRYGNDNRHFYGLGNTDNERNIPEPQDADLSFGNAAATHAVIVDEFGSYNEPEMLNSPNWILEFIDYLANWVNNRNGSGAVIFMWFSVDNSCLGTDIMEYNTNPQVEPWCTYYKTNYLQKVGASS